MAINSDDKDEGKLGFRSSLFETINEEVRANEAGVKLSESIKSWVEAGATAEEVEAEYLKYLENSKAKANRVKLVAYHWGAK